MSNIDKNILMKNNELIKARYDLTVIQSRVFIVILYKLQKDKSGEMSCVITRDEFKQLINRKNDVDKHLSYQQRKGRRRK